MDLEDYLLPNNSIGNIFENRTINISKEIRRMNRVQYVAGVNWIYQSKWKWNNCYKGGRNKDYQDQDCVKNGMIDF